MEEAEVYLERRSNVVEKHNITLLDCIGRTDPDGDMSIRAFFKTGTNPEAFRTDDTTDALHISNVASINGALVISAHGKPNDIAKFTLKNGVFDAPIQAPETDLFEGLNVLLAERNGEPIQAFEAWLTYHVRNFGVDAVLLIDRGKISENKKIMRKFKALSVELGLKRFVRLHASVPLGSNTPPANHPFHAADAPGKDRMRDLDPDPWTSPLAELSIYEWAKWRFLARAHAVANIDISDLLSPDSNPFEAVQNSSAGVIQLIGQRIYPWRVRAKDTVGFGDHICRQFENPRANRRWCVSPKRLADKAIWRFVRIANTSPQPDEVSSFWRAMGIRHAGWSAAEIVPKTSLVEDETLLGLAKNMFNHKPVRPPSSKIAKAPAKASKGGRTCIVTCMKNEGPFILEWIAYHRAIGVDDFLVYTNDCTDGTDELLNLLQARGVLQRRDNLFENSELRPQHWALSAAEDEPIMQNSGWVISMDVDEFINIHVGDGTLKDLYNEIGVANMISLTWRLFGNADVREYSDDFIISQFHRCARELCRVPHQAWGFKTLFRNLGLYKKLGVHRPRGLKLDLWKQINWVNGSGKPVPQSLFRNGWRSTIESYGYDLVTLNHYAVRSAESFLVKRDRGRVNHVERDQGLSYWFRMNNNWEEDRSIQSKMPLLQAEFDRLMADPELRAAHEFSVAQHREKINELRAKKSHSKFYEELTNRRMERLSRMHSYFRANVFLAGPQSVPDKVVDAEELPKNFLFNVEKTDTTH